jgi:hypothetical protein
MNDQHGSSGSRENGAVRSAPRDVFFHLLSFVGLYASAIALLVLLFQHVNLAFVDALEGNGYYAALASRGMIRWALASIVVAFPVFLWVSWFLERMYVASPEKRELRIRKWLVYFTLLVVTLSIGGDLITLIFRYLNGELSVRFALKVLSVFAVAGSVLCYYLWSLRRSYKSRSLWHRYCFGAIILAILVAIVSGFFVAGSPQTERLRQFDEQRVGNLQYLQSEIVYYWQRKEILPGTLADLEDALRGVSVPRDPDTDAAYEYAMKGEKAFELCATFSLPSVAASVAYPAEIPNEDWKHDAGRACFERTIDEDFFPTKPLEAIPVR